MSHLGLKTIAFSDAGSFVLPHIDSGGVCTTELVMHGSVLYSIALGDPIPNENGWDDLSSHGSWAYVLARAGDMMCVHGRPWL